MKKARFVRAHGVLALGLFLGATRCAGIADINDIVNCPPKRDIQPWSACSGRMECAWDLVTANPACDGTTLTIATSCLCAQGVWKCPNAYACAPAESPVSDEASGADRATDDGGTTGADDAPSE